MIIMMTTTLIMAVVYRISRQFLTVTKSVTEGESRLKSRNFDKQKFQKNFHGAVSN
jgi:nitrate/nitrite-specific signal transduction histidine kinase